MKLDETFVDSLVADLEAVKDAVVRHLPNLNDLARKAGEKLQLVIKMTGLKGNENDQDGESKIGNLFRTAGEKIRKIWTAIKEFFAKMAQSVKGWFSKDKKQSEKKAETVVSQPAPKLVVVA